MAKLGRPKTPPSGICRTAIHMDVPTREKIDEYASELHAQTAGNRTHVISQLLRETMQIAFDPIVKEMLKGDPLQYGGGDVMIFIRAAVKEYIEKHAVGKGDKSWL